MLRTALVTLGDPGRLTGGYLFHRRLADLAPRHDARLDFVSVPERPFPISVVHGRSALGRLIEAHADVAVIDSIAAAFLAPWLRTNKPRVPIVGMLHQPPGGIDHGPVRTFVQAWLDSLAYRRMQRLLVASEALAEDLRQHHKGAERLRVVPPGRDVAVSVGADPGDLRQGRRVALLCVGNWVERKGILSLVDAFAQLEAGAATLHLVGDTNAEPHYARRVRERLLQADVRERVVVHGPIPVSEVAALYAAADAFVLPSLREPYGTVYGEAMAFGLPVIGWRAGNLPHLAEDEREGLLVKPEDRAGLRMAMQRIADDPSLRARLGQAAQRRALDRPTWDQVAELFFAQLREVAETAQPRPSV